MSWFCQVRGVGKPKDAEDLRLRDLFVACRTGDEPGAVIVVKCFPKNNNLLDCQKAHPVIRVFQMQHARFDFDDFTTKPGRIAAVEIKPAADHCC
jgi:hypothetical protein